MGYRKRIDTIQKLCGCCTTIIVLEHMIYDEGGWSDEVESSNIVKCDLHKNQEISKNIGKKTKEFFDKIKEDLDKTDAKYRPLLYDDIKADFTDQMDKLNGNISKSRKRTRYES